MSNTTASATSTVPDKSDLQWPSSAPPPLTSALLRTVVEDFQVDEIPPCLPEGAGEHIWVKIRKRGMTTIQVVDRLSAAASIHPGMISFAGQKDRHAVTTQWFSLHVPGKVDPDLTKGWTDDLELLELKRHDRKLRRGALKGNHFKLILRQCEGDKTRFNERAEQIGREGVPDYFGEQRFGRGGSNVDRFSQLIAGRMPRGREKKSMMLSSARSWLFNQVLAQRVRAGTWNKVLDGEVVMLAGSRSIFVAEEGDETLPQRLLENDIHPTGPLPGTAGAQAELVAGEVEAEVLSEWSDMIEALVREKVKTARRPLRVVPSDWKVEWLDEASVSLEFTLPPGAYATAVIRELALYRDRRGKGIPEPKTEE